jgi:hypothetical protein
MAQIKEIDKEFAENYAKFHDYMSKSTALRMLYPGKKGLKAMKSWVNRVPDANNCIIKGLGIKDQKILEIFEKWNNPKETASLAWEVTKNDIGGHLISDITYMYWKYCDVVSYIKTHMKEMSNKVLLEQAIVTACTSYEIYLKEMIPWILKNHEESTKRFLGKLTKPIKDLGKYNFDLLGNVDDVYLELYGSKMMPVFPDLEEFYKDNFQIQLYSSKKEKIFVEKIFQVRHCIVHNAGKPDEQWRRKTGNAKFRIDEYVTERYCIKIHEKLHDAAYSIFKLLELPDEKAPWYEHGGTKSEKGMLLRKGKWRYRE